MVMTSLLLADELSEKNDELERYKVEHNSTVRDRKDEILSEKLDRMTSRIIQIAQSLEEEEPAAVEALEVELPAQGEQVEENTQEET
ncbi:MAG: hypothetical protein HWE34_07745 [Methylocystaceae bacterium]|nr:hypothetical protein [Methylocystaceae bacterium]